MPRTSVISDDVHMVISDAVHVSEDRRMRADAQVRDDARISDE
jgi:hypothetical protein